MTAEQLDRVVSHADALIRLMAERLRLRIEVDKALLRLDVIKHVAIIRSITDIADAAEIRVESRNDQREHP